MNLAYRLNPVAVDGTAISQCIPKKMSALRTTLKDIDQSLRPSLTGVVNEDKTRLTMSCLFLSGLTLHMI